VWENILDASKKFCRKILGCAGLRIGCHSIPPGSDCDHNLVALFGTLGFQCECLFFPADVELYDPSCNMNRGSDGTQDGCLRQIPLILGRPFLNTTKSTCMKEFLILTLISIAVPIGSQID
jgi:hypothetical protein